MERKISEKMRLFFGDIELDASPDMLDVFKSILFEDNYDAKRQLERLLDKATDIEYKFIISEVYYASTITVRYVVNNRTLTAKIATPMKPIYQTEYSADRYKRAQSLWNLVMQALRLKVKELQEKAGACGE
jgi:uncharacterized protein involved in exopolysaccharide biosynthesis